MQFFPNDKLENHAFKQRIQSATKTTYYLSHVVCRQVHISALTLSKMTSSMMVSMGEQKANIGLNLKFEAKGQKVLGYTERGMNGWEFSQKAIDLLREYVEKFPEISGTFDRKKGGGASTSPAPRAGPTATDAPHRRQTSPKRPTSSSRPWRTRG